MTIAATFNGRLVADPKQFGNLIVIRAVHNPGKNSKFESVFVDLKIKGDGFQGAQALKYVKGDEIQAEGRIEEEKWRNGKGSSLVMLFPALEIPWAVRQRSGEAETPVPEPDPGNGVETAGDDDPFAGIPA